jgi:hypothetical protein
MRITLDNITKRQKELLEIMWGIDSQEDLIEWTKTLDREDSNDVIILVELIKLELIEQVIESGNDFTEADDLINKIKG